MNVGKSDKKYKNLISVLKKIQKKLMDWVPKD